MNSSLQRLHKLVVVVGVPSMGDWKEKFAISHANLITSFNRFRVGAFKDQELHTVSARGSILPNLRLHILKEARRHKADYLLFIDSDQSFPAWTIHGLIDRNKDVIGANIATKTFPTLPTARRRSSEPHGALVYTDEGMQHCEEVWRLGCGLLMLSKKVIAALPNDCFTVKYLPELDKYQGEDWTLMEAIEEAGFTPWVDHALSQKVGHHGEFNFVHQYNGHITREEIPSHGLESEGQENSDDAGGKRNGTLSEDVY